MPLQKLSTYAKVSFFTKSDLIFSKNEGLFFFSLLFNCHCVHTDGHSDEEPTFILTFYEIPITQAYLPSSSNDSAMTPDLPTVETQVSLGFSDQAHLLPSTSESSRSVSSGLFYSIIMFPIINCEYSTYYICLHMFCFVTLQNIFSAYGK